MLSTEEGCGYDLLVGGHNFVHQSALPAAFLSGHSCPALYLALIIIRPPAHVEAAIPLKRTAAVQEVLQTDPGLSCKSCMLTTTSARRKRTAKKQHPQLTSNLARISQEHT